jgi:OOP family OmpA-OmpF porin
MATAMPNDSRQRIVPGDPIVSRRMARRLLDSVIPRPAKSIGEPPMSIHLRSLVGSAIAVMVFGATCGLHAQTISATAPPSDNSSLASALAGSSSHANDSFIGVAVGRSNYNTSCGNVAGLTCSHSATSYSITAGDMFTRNVGFEVSYLDLGRANRADGSVRARGLNLSAVGRLPLGETLSLAGKVGTTYGVTHVNAPALSGVSSGRDSGFGLGYGVALDVNVMRGLQGEVGWEQHDLHFAGQGKSNVSNVTLGLAYLF